MMDERMPTGLWVDALVRRAQLAGSAAFILARGDASRGDVLVKVAAMGKGARAYVPGYSLEGERSFVDLRLRGVAEEEGEIDAYITRARDRDGDLWVVEIEDRDMRHFLTEPVETPEESGA